VAVQQALVGPLALLPVLPVHPVHRELLDREDVQRLVVGLEELPLGGRSVEPPLHPPAPVVADPGCEDEVVVPRPGDLQRVELDRAELAHHPEHRLGARRQRARRREEVAPHEEAPGLLGGELQRLGASVRSGLHRAVSCAASTRPSGPIDDD